MEECGAGERRGTGVVGAGFVRAGFVRAGIEQCGAGVFTAGIVGTGCPGRKGFPDAGRRRKGREMVQDAGGVSG